MPSRRLRTCLLKRRDRGPQNLTIQLHHFLIHSYILLPIARKGIDTHLRPGQIRPFTVTKYDSIHNSINHSPYFVFLLPIGMVQCFNGKQKHLPSDNHSTGGSHSQSLSYHEKYDNEKYDNERCSK